MSSSSESPDESTSLSVIGSVVKCTYADCPDAFDTLAEMRRHKETDPKHFFCKKCSIDFHTYSDLTEHKVAAMIPYLEGPLKGSDESPQHIVCEFCGKDFHSFGGRKAHREQNHPAVQDIGCPGCNAKFTKAASMIQHLEDGRCGSISSDEFFNRIAGKITDTKLLARLTAGDEDDEGDTESAGGVPVAPPQVIDNSIWPEEPDDPLDMRNKLLEAVKRDVMTPRYPCPLCLKVFAKPSALVAHAESPGKCKLQRIDRYKRIIEEISGGYLRVDPVTQPPVLAGESDRKSGVKEQNFEAQEPIQDDIIW